jgi:hypothetical protein
MAQVVEHPTSKYKTLNSITVLHTKKGDVCVGGLNISPQIHM